MATLVLAACGSSSSGNPATLLAAAKQAIDAAPSAHFTLSSSNVPTGGTALIGGSGDLKRPNGFSGTLNVSVSGFNVNVPVVSVGGTFHARDPLSGQWQTADPAAYGFADPGTLVDPQRGLSSLLTQCQQAAVQSDDRYNGEQLHEVACMLPGHAVAALLTSADASKPVAATIGVDSGNGQLRRVVLSGPFFSTTQLSTFTLVIDNYGENVNITPPPAGS